MSAREVSRRDVLRYLAYGGVGVAAGSALVGCSFGDGSDGSNSNGGPRNQRRPGRDGRLLVVIEMGGGNDGLSTLVPFENGRYRDLRPTLAIPGDEVIDWGDGWGLNQRLKVLDDHKAALVTGIGTTAPDLSHFAMLDRWWKGFPEGLPTKESSFTKTGFLGRVCDEASGHEKLTGLSLRVGHAPSLTAAKAATTGIPDTEAAALADDDDLARLLRHAMQQFSRGDEADLVDARKGLDEMLRIFDLLDDLPEPSTGYPDTPFGLQMASASRLARSSAGIRVLHVPQGVSDYDTHAHHGENHPKLLTELNDGLAAFLKDMGEVGLADDILVATVSEFGRRVEEHEGGLDHGAASTLAMVGPVKHGIHGDPSPIEKLDQMGNLRATVTFDRYLATIAEWMQVDLEAVLPPAANGKVPEPIPGLLTV